MKYAKLDNRLLGRLQKTKYMKKTHDIILELATEDAEHKAEALINHTNPVMQELLSGDFCLWICHWSE